MTGTIYGLTTDADDGVIRYIGHTTQKLGKRLALHKAQAKNNRRAVCLWVLERLAAGFSIRIIELMRNAMPSDEAVFISKYRSDGFDLLNETADGYGTHGRVLTPAMVAVFRAPSTDTQKAAVRAFNANRDYSSVSRKRAEKWADPEHKKMMGDRIRAGRAAAKARRIEQNARGKDVCE